MTLSLRSDASRAVVVLDGVDRVAFNEDGSMELLTPAANPTGNDVPTAGQLPDVTLVRGTAQNATSGTAIDFTGIPAWAKRVTVLLNGVSTSGTSNLLLQLGTSGGITSSGYSSSATTPDGTTTTTSSTAGMVVTEQSSAASNTFQGIITVANISGNAWVSSGNLSASEPRMHLSAGGVTLSGTLDRIRLTTVNGTDTFDAGTVNIMWE